MLRIQMSENMTFVIYPIIESIRYFSSLRFRDLWSNLYEGPQKPTREPT